MCHYFADGGFGDGGSLVGGEVDSPGGADSFCGDAKNGCRHTFLDFSGQTEMGMS